MQFARERARAVVRKRSVLACVGPVQRKLGADSVLARLVGCAGSFLSPLAFWAYVNFLVVPREIRYMKDKFGDEYSRFAKK